MRVLDNILQEINLTIKENLDLIAAYTNLGTNTQFYRETELNERDGQTFPMINTGSYKGEKVSLDDRYPLQIYHRVLEANNDTDPSRGYGANSFRENIYDMRLYCLGTLKYLNNPDHLFNTDIMETVYQTLPVSLSYRERLIKKERSTKVLEILVSEFEGATVQNLIVRHVAFYIDYQLRQRSDCGVITNTPVVTLGDIVGLTANSYIVT